MCQLRYPTALRSVLLAQNIILSVRGTPHLTPLALLHPYPLVVRFLVASAPPLDRLDGRLVHLIGGDRESRRLRLRKPAMKSCRSMTYICRYPGNNPKHFSCRHLYRIVEMHVLRPTFIAGVIKTRRYRIPVQNLVAGVVVEWI